MSRIEGRPLTVGDLKEDLKDLPDAMRLDPWDGAGQTSEFAVYTRNANEDYEDEPVNIVFTIVTG